VRRTIACVVVAAAALVGGGIAIASGGPRTDDVAAVFDLVPLSSDGIQCEGIDGSYFQFVDVFRGPIVSEDPRLRGVMWSRTRSLLNLDTGQSDILGGFQIRNPTTGFVKVRGQIIGVGADGGVAKGLMKGRTAWGGRLIANFSVETDLGTGAIHGELGSPSPIVAADLAILQRGSCA
jgi:hypothetical protein